MLKYKEAILYLILIILALYFAISQTVPKVTSLVDIEKNIIQNSKKIEELTLKLDGLKKKEQAGLNTSQEIKKIYKQESADLDTEASFTVLFDDIVNMARYSGVKIFSIKYNYNPTSNNFVSQGGGKYNVCEVTMELISDYQDFQEFIKEIFKYPYLVNVEEIEMIPYQKDKKILLINTKLVLYTQKS